MHLFEYALRDFINVERFADWSSVIAFDDMLPRNVDEAARDRHTKMWTGDVYKVVPVLQKHRPDLTVIQVDTEPTGVAVVFGADATSTALSDGYADITAEWVVPDPQKVPEWITERLHAVKPEELLGAAFWHRLVRARNRRVRRSRGYSELRRQLAAVTG